MRLAYVALLSLFAGIIVMILPAVIAAGLPRRIRQRVGDWYLKPGNKAARRWAVVRRETGGLTPTIVGHSEDRDTDKVPLDEKQDFYDHWNCWGWLKNKQFALGIETGAMYADALWAELGEKYHDLVRDDNDIRTDTMYWCGQCDELVNQHGCELHPEAPLETETIERISDHVTLDKEPRLVDLHDARRMLAGAIEGRDAEKAYQQAKISQEGFHKRVSAGQAITIGLMFALGGALVWFVANYGDAAVPTDGGGTVLPIVIGGLL